MHGGADGSGGQPGNQNARKHGFYSRRIPTDHEADYDEALRIEGLDQEIALLRVLIDKQLAEGANLEDIAKGMDILVRMVGAQYRMSSKAKASLTDAIAEVLERLGAQFSGVPS